MPMVPVVSVVGWSDSGKTTYMVKLIKEMARRGMAVLAIKHTHHPGIDVLPAGTSNKDTDRFKRAGAVESLLIGPVWDQAHGGEEKIGMDDLCRLAAEHAPKADIILIEGMKTGPAPKIEVRRRDSGNPAIGDPAREVIAVVADFLPDVPAPVFHPDDVAAMVDFLMRLKPVC